LGSSGTVLLVNTRNVGHNHSPEFSLMQRAMEREKGVGEGAERGEWKGSQQELR
jgi:hypothetical protein